MHIHAIIKWIIYLVRTQNFLQKQHFAPTSMHTYVCISGGKKN